MAAWRMAFRVGTEGASLWPECRRLGGAAIGYDEILGTDLSAHSPDEPNAPWKQLAPAQQASIKRFAYEMRPGDTIYVKEGPVIVGRGVVTSPYTFIAGGFVREDTAFPWQHQRAVIWQADFPEVNRCYAVAGAGNWMWGLAR